MNMSTDTDSSKQGDLCKHEGWTDIKEKKRGCTDILLLLMLIACWAAMTGVGLVVTGLVNEGNTVLPTGDPRRLLNPVDYDGRICGVDSGVADKPFGYYLLNKSVVCVKECPTENDILTFICKDDYVPGNDIEVLSFNCMYLVKSKAMLNRCYSDTDAAAVASAFNTLTGPSVSTIAYSSNDNSNWFNQMLSDMLQYKEIIFGVGLGISNVVAFAYLFLLRIPGVLFVAIWGIILTIFAAILAGGILLLLKAESWKTDGIHTTSDVQVLQVISYIVLALAGLYALLMCVLRRRIQLAMHILKEAARAMAAMPLIVLLPLMQAAGLCLFLVPWIIFCLYLASSGNMTMIQSTYVSLSGQTIPYTYKSFEYGVNTKYAFLYMLFCWFWTSQFIIAFGQLTIALALVAWYFTHEKSKIGSGTVFWAFYTIMRYHLGTAAFGSLIIAIIKTIRAILLYLQKKCRESKNKVMEAIMMCLGCCMWCVEKCIKFLNKNAYVQTALYGTSFCASCRKAFFLIARNILRVAAVNMVADFILFLGRFFIPVVTTLMAYFGLAYQTGSSHGLVLPLFFVFILSYFIGCMYADIFGMSIETILCCFVADEEMFPPELRYAENGLRSALQVTQQTAAQENPQVGVAPSSEKSSKAPAKADDELM